MSDKRILLVDDEIELVDLVQMRLEAEGYEVDIAHDGNGALDRIHLSPPDLIILDLMLPGVDGYQICSTLKQDEQYKNIPIIIFSAKTQEQDEQKAMNLGADGYLRKPFRPDELLAAVQRFV